MTGYDRVYRLLVWCGWSLTQAQEMVERLRGFRRQQDRPSVRERTKRARCR